MADTSPHTQESLAELTQVCSTVAELNAEIDRLTVIKKDYMKRVDELATATNTEKLSTDTWSMFLSAKTTNTIKPELLLQNGVDMDVIKRSTVTTTTPFYQVRRVPVKASKAPKGQHNDMERV